MRFASRFYGMDWLYQTSDDDAILFLLDAYPDIASESNQFGNYPLHAAVYDGIHKSYRIIMKLIELYPDAVRHKNYAGEYPLHIACQFCDEHIILELMNRFPRAVEEKDRRDRSPLHLAVNARQSERIILILITQYPTIVTESFDLLGLMVDKYSERVIGKLLELNPSAAFVQLEHSQNYPIHQAIQYNPSDAVVHLLLALDPIAVRRYSDSGETTLHIAFTRKRYHLADYMIQRHATRHNNSNIVNIKMESGGTPLHYA
jgi:ankyrin repeat protein